MQFKFKREKAINPQTKTPFIVYTVENGPAKPWVIEVDPRGVHFMGVSPILENNSDLEGFANMLSQAWNDCVDIRDAQRHKILKKGAH